MKKIYALFAVAGLCCLVSSCKTELSVDTSPSTQSEVGNVSESICVQEYLVSPVSSSVSFDEIVDVWSEYLDVDIRSFDDINVFNENDLQNPTIDYQEDFQTVLVDMRRSDRLLEEMFGPTYISDPWCFLRGTESDSHITRSLTINGLRVYEFDDSEWTEIAYRETVDSVFLQNSETIDSSLEQGYCFIYDLHNENQRRFFATYLLNNCIISYSCSTNDSVRYDLYCDLCERLGLPTSEVGSEIIHMHSETE